MAGSLPSRGSLAELRLRARELRDAAVGGDAAALNRVGAHVGQVARDQVTLALAQLVLAREHGFTSWARLKAAVEDSPDLAGSVDAFLVASVTGRIEVARRLLAAQPEIASYDVSTACVLGDVAAVHDVVDQEPAAAVRADQRRGWPPLLYATHSAWHRVDTERAEGILQVVWLLLEAGADPNSSNGRPARNGYCSALSGAAGVADNAPVTSVLLRYGADPNDDESLYHAAEHADRACLRLLLGHGARVDGTNALAAAVAPGNAEGVRLLIEAGGDPGRPARAVPDGRLADRSLAPLPLAVQTCGADVVDVLLAAGADPDARGTDHRSAIRSAARAGNQDVVRLLLRHGAHDDRTEVDNFLGACLRADRNAAERLVGRSPGLRARLTADDLGALADAAEHADIAAVRLMLDLGFPVGAQRADGATPLHAAGYAGRAPIVALLLSRGADVDAPDGHWGASALAWTTIGSGEQPRDAHDADWPATVRTLVAAGSRVDDAWIDGKPPSEPIAALLVALGIEEPDDD